MGLMFLHFTQTGQRMTSKQAEGKNQEQKSIKFKTENQ